MEGCYSTCTLRVGSAVGGVRYLSRSRVKDRQGQDFHQCRMMSEMSSTFSLSSNSISSSIPTQLGLMSEMASFFMLKSNSISSSIPTQLGQLDHMSSGFWLNSNSLSSAIPTQLGGLVQMTSRVWLNSNSLWSAIPTQVLRVCVERGRVSACVPGGV